MKREVEKTMSQRQQKASVDHAGGGVMTGLRRFWAAREGAAALEFALVGPIILH